VNGSRVSAYGFHVPYRSVGLIEGALEQCEAVISLMVIDLTPGSTFCDFIPFVIDTGTDVTIIPRNLVPRSAFPVQGANTSYEVPVTGLTGRTLWARIYSASLAIVPPTTKFGGLGFNVLTIVVVDTWEGECAVLGLDALRQVVVVSDPKHITFWPLSLGQK